MYPKSKRWYKSITIWSGMVSFAAGISSSFAVAIGAIEQLVGIEVVLSLATSCAGFLSIYGRLRANSRVY